MPTLLALLGGAMAVVAVSPPVAATPGSPGLPGASAVLFEEDFEHGLADGEVALLGDYVGAGGQTYSAQGGWADPARGNGFILDGADANAAAIAALGYAAQSGTLRVMANQLGAHNGTSPSENNHVVAANTAGTAMAPNLIEFQTAARLNLPVSNRFLTFSANVAARNCAVSGPRLRFFLEDETGTQTEVSDTPTNACAGGDGASTVSTDGSILFTGDELGVVMRNVNGDSAGNDHAFDDIRVLDSTPQLDKAFSPASVPAGFTSRMTFTVTNTDELASKQGWSFTDNLPAGLVVSGQPGFATTCSNGAITAGNAAGATSVSFSGDLDAGQASCTVSVDVLVPTDADAGDVFTNSPGNVTDLVGLNAPAAAKLTVRNAVAPQVDCSPAELRATQRWWFMGTAAGLDFGASGTAAPAATSGAGASAEGTTVVSDTSGELLFWANGDTIYNRNHVPMPNGTGLSGNPSATQTVAAFPALGHPGRYFVVTTSGAEQVNGQLRYSTIDMTLDNGLGDVTAVKDVDLGPANGSAEGLTAIPNDDGTGFWVISSQNSSPNVRAYFFDSDGPADPDGAGPLNAGDAVITALPTNNFNQYSAFNLSPDLSTVVMTTNPQGGNATSASRIRLLDFDAATGQFGQRMEWSAATGAGSGNALYTADFSPSGRYLYASKIFGGAKLYRYDLSGAADGAAVKATETEIGGIGGNGGQVRRGPDGRMYAANSNGTALSVVNAPDAANASDVDFGLHAVTLSPGGSRFGLPQMVTGCPLPLLQFEKSVSPSGAAVGQTVTFTFKVTNNTGDDLEALAIDDPMIPAGDIDCPALVVPAGASVTCTADYVVAAGDVVNDQVVNTADMSVVPLGGDPAVDGISRTDTAILAVLADPSLALVKTAALTTDNGTVGVADAGDVITYTFTVTNDGDVLVEGIAIDDSLPGLSAITPASIASLAAGDDATFTATYTVTQADVDNGGKVVNTATATGTDPSGGDVTSPGDGAEIDLVTRAPGLELEKGSVLGDTNGNGVADKGETITYSFRAENTGNVTLTGVSISDAMAGLSAITPASATVAPGASATFAATYVVTQADVDAGGSLVNTATASGTGPGGGSVASDPDGSSTGLVPHAPGLSIDKVSELDDANNNGLADVDETISYTFTVQNTGNVTISGISVTDPMVSGVTPSNVTLAPGATQVFTADDYVVTQADVDWGSVVNIATVTGTRPGGAVVSEDDVDTVDTVDPVAELDVVKSSALTIDKAVSGKADVGDEVTYTFVVTNTGTGTAHDVAIVDALPGLSAVTPSSVVDLAPGASATFTATYAVKLKDLKVGEIVNVAKASFVPPNPGGGPAPDPLMSGPSNVVKVPGGPTQPSLSTKASAKRVVLGVGGGGRTGSVELFDTVTLKEFVAGSTSVGRATLYGPTAKRSASMCAPGNKVRTVTFKPRNGVNRTPKVRVTEPGYYTWVVTTSADEENLAASHGCGLASETTLVHRPGYGVVRIDTGASLDFFARLANPSRVKIKALGMDAVVQPVGKPGGVMRIPGDVSVGGWLSSSAAPGERVGSAVVAGHVSDMGDRPGQFGKLNKARKGQVVAVTGADGKVHRYRISKVYSQLRTKRLASSLFSTRGAHQLVLVTCTGKVTGPGGRFHYTRNQVVIAKPIR